MIGGMEWIITLLVVLAVLLFGGKKIPELARAMGKAVSEFQLGKKEAEKEIREALEGPKSKIEKVALELGINPKGKSEEELKEEIKKHLNLS